MNDDASGQEGDPDDMAEDAAQDAAELDLLRAENVALKDQMLRIAADAENSKRRAEREANDSRAYAIQKFARDLMPVADALQRALQHAPQGSPDPLVKNLGIGLEMTEKELMGAFERNGLKKIDPAPGSKFDPHQHQAMLEQPSDDVAAGGVVQVVQPGYDLFGRVLRAAMVVVAAKGSKGAEPVAGGAPNPYAAANDPDAGASIDTKA